MGLVRGPWRLRAAPRRLVPVLTVLVLLGSGLSLALALTRPDPGPSSQLPGVASGSYVATRLGGPGGPAIEVMAEVLPVALGYDFRTLDEGLEQATGSMTAPFAARFTESFDATARRLATRQRAVVEARVDGAGQVRLVDADTVLGLAYVDQLLTRGQGLAPGAEPRLLNRYRVLVRLVRVDEEWKVANISPV